MCSGTAALTNFALVLFFSQMKPYKIMIFIGD